jgi:hypothetical protein
MEVILVEILVEIPACHVREIYNWNLNSISSFNTERHLLTSTC